MAVEIIYVDPAIPGYQGIYYMARLAAELFSADLMILRSPPLTLVDKLYGLVPRKKQGRIGIIICPQPASLISILSIKGWRTRYSRLAAWVFDSFWPEYTSRIVRYSGIFDHVFIAEEEDLDTWQRMMRAPVEWLPWGSDALRLGSSNPERPTDVLRFGRQPPDWEDDHATNEACESMGLRFQGRPPYESDPCDGERALMATLRRTKFTLSFSNRVSPSIQTHPHREYVSGRWTDALSAGCIVAGMPPKCSFVEKILWNGALLDLATVNRDDGLKILATATRSWSAERAMENHLRALERLDWRWRFKTMARCLDIHAPALNKDLDLLQTAMMQSTTVNSH